MYDCFVRYLKHQHVLASKIAATWKMKLQRTFYKQLRPAQIIMSKHWKRHVQQRWYAYTAGLLSLS